MGMDLGGGKGKHGPRPTMNVTPLVDIVLVLLIIFMVITPLLTKQFWLHVPRKDDDKVAEPAPADANPPVVLTVSAAGKAFVNKDEVADADLSQKLLRVFAARSDTVLFFDAHDDAPYGRAMEVLDLARGGGALTVAVLTEKVAK